MKTRTRIIAAALFAASTGLCAGAFAQTAQTDAYGLDSRGTVWKNPYGLCWRTSQWTPAKAIEECDPDLVRKPAPKPAAAPVPAPAPAVVPAPVVVPPAPARPLDSDGDGVPDNLDRCPNTVAGAKVDAQGCELDSDRDGVVDRLDKCPGTRAGVKVDASGCEIVEAIILKGVNFATNSATLTGGSTAVLDQAAAALVKRGDVKVEVGGHTDNRGTAARNRVLSQQRAETVMRYLVSKGVNAANLTARGYGQERPIANNATEQGRAANRRVELVIK